MIVLAIDSGLERTGYSIFDKDKKFADGYQYISSGLISTDKKEKIEDRLHTIFDQLNKLIAKYKPQTIVVEQLFFFKNQKTVIKVGQAQGVVMLAAAQHAIPLEFLTPLQIKLNVTGYGQSDKKSVQKMLGITLKLNGELKQDDQADAIACGLAFCNINPQLL